DHSPYEGNMFCNRGWHVAFDPGIDVSSCGFTSSFNSQELRTDCSGAFDTQWEPDHLVLHVTGELKLDSGVMHLSCLVGVTTTDADLVWTSQQEYQSSLTFGGVSTSMTLSPGN